MRAATLVRKGRAGYDPCVHINANEIIHWLSATGLSQLIQTTSWAIPGDSGGPHLCLATLFALALNLALRIAGRGLAAEPLASLAGRFVPAMWICLVVLFVSGALLIIAEPFRTITNPVFYLKMSLLLVAIALTLWLASFARRSRGAAPIARRGGNRQHAGLGRHHRRRPLHRRTRRPERAIR